MRSRSFLVLLIITLLPQMARGSDVEIPVPPLGTAEGSVTVGETSIRLNHARAFSKRFSFDPKTVETFVILTAEPGSPDSQWIDDAHGILFTLDSQGAISSLLIQHPDYDWLIRFDSFRNPARVERSAGGAAQITGRLHSNGSHTYAEAFDYQFDVKFSAKIADPNPQIFLIDSTNGKRLGKGGGEPGATWLAYEKLLRTDLMSAFTKYNFDKNGTAAEEVLAVELTPEEQTEWDEALKAINELVWQSRGKDPSVYDGYIDREKATLFVTGRSPNDPEIPVYAQVNMIRVDGSWKVATEAWGVEPYTP